MGFLTCKPNYLPIRTYLAMPSALAWNIMGKQFARWCSFVKSRVKTTKPALSKSSKSIEVKYNSSRHFDD